MNVFKDLKVVELASVLAGPAVGMFLAELGAKVIKIENKKTNGDVTRNWKSYNEKTENLSAYFSSVNWGKEHLFLDYTNEKDFSQLLSLCKEADVIICNCYKMFVVIVENFCHLYLSNPDYCVLHISDMYLFLILACLHPDNLTYNNDGIYNPH